MERKEIEKTIATCTPSEFMAQCYKIAGKTKTLFEMAGIADIRKRMPEYKEEDTPEERKAKMKKQGRDNLWAIFDELFGVMCFIGPSEIDSDNGMELTAKCIEMLGDENVATFLVSLSKILRQRKSSTFCLVWISTSRRSLARNM